MGLGLSFNIRVGSRWWAVDCGDTVGLGLNFVDLLGVSHGGSMMWWLLVLLLMVGGGCVVDGGSMGNGVVDDGSVGGDWKFWVDRWVTLFLMAG